MHCPEARGGGGGPQGRRPPPEWSWPESHRPPSRCHRDALLSELQPRFVVMYPSSGGATGNRTPTPAVRKQSSPVELSPQTAGNNSHGLRRASEWRPRRMKYSVPPPRDAGVATCSRAAAAMSRSGPCTRGTRWSKVRRHTPSLDAPELSKKSSRSFPCSAPSGSPGNRTLSPRIGSSAGHHDSATQVAPRTGIEPVSSHRQWDCDASRITRQCFRYESVPGRTRTCLERFRKSVPFHSATRTGTQAQAQAQA